MCEPRVESQCTKKVHEVYREMDPKGIVHGLGTGMQTKVPVLLLGLAFAGYGRARLVSGRRSMIEQARLYGKGRSPAECVAGGVQSVYSRPLEDKVTWTKPTESKHVTGRAVDVDLSAYYPLVSAEIGGLAKSLGLKWGGEWRVVDGGHFEEKEG